MYNERTKQSQNDVERVTKISTIVPASSRVYKDGQDGSDGSWATHAPENEHSGPIFANDFDSMDHHHKARVKTRLRNDDDCWTASTSQAQSRDAP